MQAYSDDFQVVTVYMNKQFYNGESDEFYLRDITGKIYGLNIDNIEKREHSVKYTLNLADSLIEVGKEYDLVECHGLFVPLQFRYIVKTKEFNDKFYNARDDFGATVVNDETTFTLWAPTATAVSVIINPHGAREIYTMQRVDKGAWQVKIAKNLHNHNYLYLLNVNGGVVETLDPYGCSSSANNKSSSVIDFQKIDINFYDEKLPKIPCPIIFEANVRDFSIDPNTNIKHKGKFLGMIEEGRTTKDGFPCGFDYFKSLGATHIQLMPINDFISTDELTPLKFYNWGYDPVQYNSIEGSYSTDPNNPLARVSEFSKLISKFHENGIRVIIDVVYNHMFDLHQSSFEKIVPYYAFRRMTSGEISNGSFCGNDIDSEMPMIRKFIVSSIKHYINNYHIDGFRFDLMGLLDLDTMNEVQTIAKSLNPDIMIYGEGWDMPTMLDDDKKTKIANCHKIDNVAYFNDHYRNCVKGGIGQESKFHRGYALGDRSSINAFKASLLANTREDLGFKLFNSPMQSISYAEAHDNMTLWDKISIALETEPIENKVKIQKFANAIIALSQGISFYHMGQEFCRTKNGVENSYMSPDTINMIDYARAMEFQHVIKYTKDIINIRKNIPAFCLQSIEEINGRFEFEEMHNGALLMKILNTAELTPYQEILVYFNPFKTDFRINFETEFVQILDENGSTDKKIKELHVTPISIAIACLPK